MKNLWVDNETVGLDHLSLLVYQSRLIGSNGSLVLWGGPNTSIKTTGQDFRSLTRRILLVKGSGTDLKYIDKSGFSSLLMDEIVELMDRDDMSDESMVDYINHCMVKSDAPRPSIETLLHAFLPYTSVVHSHPDAILSITNNNDPVALINSIFDGSVIPVSYHRPGFKLSKEVATEVQKKPAAEGVILINHGLVTWGDTPKQAYNNHIRLVSKAEKAISIRRKAASMSSQQLDKYVDPRIRKQIASAISPIIRGTLSEKERMLLRFEDSKDVMRFVNSSAMGYLTSIGAATPDHLLNTKNIPAVLGNPSVLELSEAKKMTKQSLYEYAENYANWFKNHDQDLDNMANPFPRVILMPGIGMWTTGKNSKSARIASDIYKHTISIMSGASVLGQYSSLTSEEVFRAEYWPLELYKQSLAPKERELSRKVVLITGAASGIGKEIAIKFALEGAHVMITDIDMGKLNSVATEIQTLCGEDTVRQSKMDVTKEFDVQRVFQNTVLAFGGLDILVSNAGIAQTGAIENLHLADWERSLSINTTGHFLVAKEALGILREQGIGGSLIFIGTKNVPAPGQDFGAYSASKAAEAQLARVIAIENGQYGIRSNMINPDAIFQDSGLWSTKIREERAHAHGIEVKDIEAFYSQRNLLKTSVTSRDVAEAALYLAGDRSIKTTGAMIPVDGGVREAFPR